MLFAILRGDGIDSDFEDAPPAGPVKVCTSLASTCSGSGTAMSSAKHGLRPYSAYDQPGSLKVCRSTLPAWPESLPYLPPLIALGLSLSSTRRPPPPPLSFFLISTISTPPRARSPRHPERDAVMGASSPANAASRQGSEGPCCVLVSARGHLCLEGWVGGWAGVLTCGLQIAVSPDQRHLH